MPQHLPHKALWPVGGQNSDADSVGERRAGTAAAIANPFEARLFRLLRRLPPEARHAVLASRFSEPQRLALERWILERQPTFSKCALPRKRVVAPVSRGSEIQETKAAGAARFPGPADLGDITPMRKAKKLRPGAICSSPSAKAPKASQRCSAGGVDTRTKQVCVAAVDQVHQLARSPNGSGRSSSVGIPGIHRRLHGGRMWYRATVNVGPFVLHSKYDANLDQVRIFREALEAIRERLLKETSFESDGDPQLEDVFRRAVFEEPANHGLGSAADMGFCFLGQVAARHWVGQALITPRFPAGRLDEGLRAWRRLGEARKAVYCGRANGHTIQRRNSPNELAAAWSRLRNVYLDVCAEAGRGGRSHAIKRLQRLEERRRSAQRCQRRPAPCDSPAEESSSCASTVRKKAVGTAMAAASALSIGVVRPKTPRKKPPRQGIAPLKPSSGPLNSTGTPEAVQVHPGQRRIRSCTDIARKGVSVCTAIDVTTFLGERSSLRRLWSTQRQIEVLLQTWAPSCGQVSI